MRKRMAEGAQQATFWGPIKAFLPLTLPLGKWEEPQGLPFW